MDSGEIVRMRLRNQRLVGAGDAEPAAVVAWFGAMQSQEYALARWSVGQRAPGLDDASVKRAVDEGRILRTHALRPTWHFIAAADLRWIQALTAPRVHAFNAYYYRTLGLDEGTAERTNAVIVDALRGGNHLTRKELGAVLVEDGLPAANKLGYVVMQAELDGLIANGPMRGNQHTYALVEERAPVQTELHGDAALAELTRRYFTSHGPATVKDFAWWSSLTLTQIRHGIALLGDELASAEVGGRRYWWAASTTVDGTGAPVGHVLQAYDEYVVAYTESRDVVTRADPAFGPTSGNTSAHSVSLDGQLVAMWRPSVSPAAITAQVRPLRPLSTREHRRVAEAFARYSAFAGVPVQVQTLTA
jgi:DNA glycosylase AlkZ-like